MSPPSSKLGMTLLSRAIPVAGFGWLALIFSLSLSLVFRNILSPYDLSYDELYSTLSISSADILASFRQWILPDTHPPLYAVLLFVWRSLWGDQEVSLRLLSALISISTLLLWAFFAVATRSLPLYLGFSFMALNPYFVYHSNEVRGYSYLIFSSTFVLFCFLIRQRRLLLCEFSSGPLLKKGVDVFSSDIAFALLLLQVSLVHYYGLFFALCLLGLDFAFSRRVSSVSLVGLALLFVWPFIHLVLFDSGQSSRVSWLKDMPFFAPVEAFAVSNLPTLRLYQLVSIISLLVVLSAPRLLDASRPESLDLRAFARLVRPLLILLIVFLLFVTAIDLAVPLSLDKYFVALLPVTSLLLGASLSPPFVFCIRSPRSALISILFPLVLFVAFSVETLRGLWASSVVRVDSKVSFQASNAVAYLRRTGVCADGCLVGPGLTGNPESGDLSGMVLRRYLLRSGFFLSTGPSGDAGLVLRSSEPFGGRSVNRQVHLTGYDLGGSISRRNSKNTAIKLALFANGYKCFWSGSESPINLWIHRSDLPALKPQNSGFSLCSLG